MVGAYFISAFGGYFINYLWLLWLLVDILLVAIGAYFISGYCWSYFINGYFLLFYCKSLVVILLLIILLVVIIL
jgi:hypothetical protein